MGVRAMMVLRGQTAHFAVYYDDALANGIALADAVLAGCESDLAQLSAFFGGIMAASAYTVNLQAGVGSASHATCLDTDIFYPAGNASPDGVLSTIDAEVAEVLMATQNLGFNCGFSNGEALSRVLPTVLYPERAVFFSIGSDWLNSSSPARPDFVSSNAPTDQDSIATGCGMLFLNYLAHQLNFSWQQIIAAAGPTLAQTATNLGVPNPFGDFAALLAAHFPVGTTTDLPDDDPFPLTAQPTLYIRHNLADDGTSHTGPLANSPDIIVKNSFVPSAVFSTPLSIYSDQESDQYVLAGQENFLYLRVWNRGPDATDVTANVYWSPPATLVTPNLWHFITGATLPHVAVPGNIVEVTQPLGWDQSAIPAPGHYCFIATVGNAESPAPNPGTFNTFQDFVNYIYAHNNITWRNFNVAAMGQAKHGHFRGFVALPFLITGAWDQPQPFAFDVIANLPGGARLALETSHRLARLWKQAPKTVEEHEDVDADPDDRHRARIFVAPHGTHHLGQIELPAETAAPSHLLVSVPAAQRKRTYEVAIRQTWREREVGRITWRFSPRARPLPG